MIIKLSLITLILGCSQPYGSAMSQSRRLAGPYLKSHLTIPSPSGGEHSAHIQANTNNDLRTLALSLERVAPFVSQKLAETQVGPCTDGLINIHAISEEKMNNRDIMIFTKDQPAGMEFFGITKYLHPNLAWSFICSDCSESIETILIHELTHFLLDQCGVGRDKQDEKPCHDMVEEYAEYSGA